MVQITISDELAQAISKAGSVATLIDSRGRTVAQVAPIEAETAGPIGMTDEHWTEIERRMAEDDGRRYPLSEVIERVRALAPE